MKKSVFVFIVSVLTLSILFCSAYATTLNYSSTIPAWKANVTLCSGAKQYTGSTASNYIYEGEIDPDVDVWFDVRQSNDVWITVTDVIRQVEDTTENFTLYNSYGSGTTMRLRGRATGWGWTTYEIDGYANIH